MAGWAAAVARRSTLSGLTRANKVKETQQGNEVRGMFKGSDGKASWLFLKRFHANFAA